MPGMRCCVQPWLPGASAVLQQVRRGRMKTPWPWLDKLCAHKPHKLASVALANKLARIAWKLMVSGETYRPLSAKEQPACV